MLAQTPYFPDVPPELTDLLDTEGISLAGVSDAESDDDAEGRYAEWIASGRHGEMSYLRDHAPLKYRPRAIMPGCRSILSVAFNYYQHAPWKPGRVVGALEPVAAGRVARYAWGRDYHRALGKRLRRAVKKLNERYPDSQFRSFTDATPLAERHYGQTGGIGFTGRNTLLISGQYGSWFFVGEILSTRWFPASRPPEHRHGACPRSCRRCIDVCPTGALERPNRIDARRCISYLTIEHRGSIPAELRRSMGDWIFGCDLCQEVCPLNVRAQVTRVDDFRKHRAGSALGLDEVLGIADREEFVSRFAGTPIMRPGRVGMIRNACVAAGNLGDRRLLGRLQALAHDSEAIIREHARWAIDSIVEGSTE